MNRDEVRAILRICFQKYSRRLPQGYVITDSTALIADLNIDSADMVDIVLDVEDQFNIQVPDSQFSYFRTIGDLVDFIESNTQTSLAGS